MLKIMVIDGQGGGIGKAIIEKIRKESLEGIEIIALGTNSAATQGMIKAGAKVGATGENAIIRNAEKADVIMGPIAIVITNALMGEITPAISASIGSSDALKILIPLNRCQLEIPGTSQYSFSELIDIAVEDLLVKRLGCNS